MNYDTIKKRIEQFKSRDNYDKNIYNKIVNDLDELYKNKSKAIIQLTSNQYILTEKENFQNYIIQKLLKKAIAEVKQKNYENGHKYIEQLIELKPSEEYKEKINKVEQFCKINLTMNEGKKLIEDKQFKEAIQFFKNLKEDAINLEQHDIYNQGYELAKNKYFTFLNEELVDLLPKKGEKQSLKKYQDIIQKCEFIFNEFHYERKLNSKISDIKNKIYRLALEKIMEEKASKNKDFTEYMEKFRVIFETENVDKNTLINLRSSILKKMETPNIRNSIQKNSLRRSRIQFLKSTEFTDISLNTVDYYLNIIKNINQNKKDGLEEEIKNQIINYNNEMHLEHDNISNWLDSNNCKIKDNNYRGNIFAVFNSINFTFNFNKK